MTDHLPVQQFREDMSQNNKISESMQRVRQFCDIISETMLWYSAINMILMYEMILMISYIILRQAKMR